MCRAPSVSHVINLAWHLRPVCPGLILCSVKLLDHSCSSSCPIIQDESVHACQDSIRESMWAAMLHLRRLPCLYMAPFIIQLYRHHLQFHLNSLSGGIPFTCIIFNQILHPDTHPLSSYKLSWTYQSFLVLLLYSDETLPSFSFCTPSKTQPNLSQFFLPPFLPKGSFFLIMFSQKLHFHSVYLQVLKFCHASLKVLTFQFRLNYSVAHFQPNSSFLQGQFSSHQSPNSLQVLRTCLQFMLCQTLKGWWGALWADSRTRLQFSAEGWAHGSFSWKTKTCGSIADDLDTGGSRGFWFEYSTFSRINLLNKPFPRAPKELPNTEHSRLWVLLVFHGMKIVWILHDIQLTVKRKEARGLWRELIW